MLRLSRSIRALFRTVPRLPGIDGNALVFGGAPEPEIPEDLLDTATFVSTNASQVYLERFGISKPHITCMRGNMAIGTEIDIKKTNALRDRKTRTLIISEHRSDRGALRQLELLDNVNYSFDDLIILDRIDRMLIENTQLHQVKPFMLNELGPSMGLFASLTSLMMGASTVTLAGVSFRSRGCSYLEVDYDRNHVDGDRAVIKSLCDLSRPVFAADAALASDTPLQLWEPKTGAA